MRSIHFSNGQYYHIYNRGVDKRAIFLDEYDRARFLAKLKEFLMIDDIKGSELICYCLMGNHYHIVLRQESERGISETMRRVGSSHTHYFNNKYKRTGRLFEGPYKIKHIDSDAYLATSIPYIHMNPIPKDYQIKDSSELWSLIKKLENYPWSDCDQYLKHQGKGSFVFDDIPYSQFLRQSLRWRRGEPGSWEPGSDEGADECVEDNIMGHELDLV